MTKRTTKPSLSRLLRAEIRSTNHTVNLLSRASRSINAFDHARADAAWIALNGPMSAGRKFGLALGRMVKTMKREALYAMILPFKFLLIGIFNLVWFFFLVWFIPQLF